MARVKDQFTNEQKRKKVMECCMTQQKVHYAPLSRGNASLIFHFHYCGSYFKTGRKCNYSTWILIQFIEKILAIFGIEFHLSISKFVFGFGTVFAHLNWHVYLRFCLNKTEKIEMPEHKTMKQLDSQIMITFHVVANYRPTICMDCC